MKNKPLTDADGEVRELTTDDFKKFQPASKVVPDDVEVFKRARGRPISRNPKVSVTLRLDAEIIEHFKADGKGWQSRLNSTLKAAISK